MEARAGILGRECVVCAQLPVQDAINSSNLAGLLFLGQFSLASPNKAGARGESSSIAGRALTRTEVAGMLVQYGCPVISTCPEAEQRVTEVRPLSPRRFEARFES